MKKTWDTIVIFIDLSKAFDTVNHDTLLKTIRYVIRGNGFTAIQ